MKVDFSSQIKEIVDKNNIQLRSLDFLEEKVKQQFLQRRRKALVLVRGKVYELEINPVDATLIDIFDAVLSPHLKDKELVLIILPTDSSKRYVMQTAVIGRFVDKFRLKILDPRKNIRFPLQKGACSVKVWPLSDLVAMKMQAGELRAIRDKQEEEGLMKIVDGLHEPEQKGSAADYRDLLASKPLAATLLDISLGGACLIAKQDEKLQAHQLLVVEMNLSLEEVTLFLRPLAVVRNRVDFEQGLKLNLRFIARLDDEVEALLGQLFVE